MTRKDSPLSNFGRRHPRLFVAALLLMGTLVILLLLYQLSEPTVLYEEF